VQCRGARRRGQGGSLTGACKGSGDSISMFESFLLVFPQPRVFFIEGGYGSSGCGIFFYTGCFQGREIFLIEKRMGLLDNDFF
jgi:hypothetical protein